MTHTNTIGNIMLTSWRIAFANGLWEATQVQGKGRAAFSASFIAPVTHPDMVLIQKTMLAVAENKWGAQGGEILQALWAGGRVCLRDGNSKPDIEGYPGNWFISSRSPTNPLVIDQNRQELSSQSGKPYSGSYVNVRLNIWAQSNEHGKRMNAQLAGVQFVKDGEPFSGGGSADAEEFGEVEQTVAAAQEFGDVLGAVTIVDSVPPVAPGVFPGQITPVVPAALFPAPAVPLVPAAPVVPGAPPIVDPVTR